MNPDFDRLFRLAKKTGDTLIVLDSESGNHHVIMDIGRYEDLVMDQSMFLGSTDSGDAGFSSGTAQHAPHLAPETRDSFTQKDKPWHAAGDVLDNLYPEFNVAPNTSEDTLTNASFNTDEDIKLNFEPVESIEGSSVFESPFESGSAPFEQGPDLGESLESPQAESFEPAGDAEESKKGPNDASIEYDPIMQEPQPIPPAEEGEAEADVYDEENLGEEPIFFEEPLT